MVNYVRKRLSPTEEVDLFDLQQKLVILLCIHAMGRPTSDIGRIQFRDILIEHDSLTKTITGFHIQVREPKEGQEKLTSLGFLAKEQKQLCVASTLLLFMNKTAEIRSRLPPDHTLFLTRLNQENGAKIHGIQPSTIAGWLPVHMKNAGIPEAYTPHSFRSASSTKAVVNGNSMRSVKQHANWSHGSNTFEKYYYKPPMRIHNSAKIQHSIFATENSTTSESEAKATRIVLGTTYNTQVAEAKDEEVVQARPW